MEDVQDPGNVGTMIRTADAAGFDGVMLRKPPQIYTVSRPFDPCRAVISISLSGNWIEKNCWKRATQSHLAVLATTLSEASIDYRQLPQTDQFILVMGNEGNGISQEMAAQADQLVHIPMPGRAESLNVAVAAGILMFSLRKF